MLFMKVLDLRHNLSAGLSHHLSTNLTSKSQNSMATSSLYTKSFSTCKIVIYTFICIFHACIDFFSYSVLANLHTTSAYKK